MKYWVYLAFLFNTNVWFWLPNWTINRQSSQQTILPTKQAIQLNQPSLTYNLVAIQSWNVHSNSQIIYISCILQVNWLFCLLAWLLSIENCHSIHYSVVIFTVCFWKSSFYQRQTVSFSAMIWYLIGCLLLFFFHLGIILNVVMKFWVDIYHVLYCFISLSDKLQPM